MPVIAVAPNDELLEKLKSNLQEVRARGGELYVFADAGSEIPESEGRAHPAHARALRPAVAGAARDPAAAAAYHASAGEGHGRG
jgi:glucosamine--fructose-6-phosphate aminotransferase (isomerizing)